METNQTRWIIQIPNLLGNRWLYFHLDREGMLIYTPELRNATVFTFMNAVEKVKLFIDATAVMVEM